MDREPVKTLPVSALSIFAVLAAIAMWLVLDGRSIPADQPSAGGQVAETHPGDQHYFHSRPGEAHAMLNPADAAMQVKGVAANRHVPLPEVRRLMDDHIDGRDLPLGRQQVDIRDLNHALDERWPIK